MGCHRGLDAAGVWDGTDGGLIFTLRGEKTWATQPGGSVASLAFPLMRPVHSFRIEPTLPARFADLRRVAGNLRWTWDERALALFADLDPAAWDKSHHDPIRLLELISPERWAVLAEDGRIANEIDAVVDEVSARVEGDTHA